MDVQKHQRSFQDSGYTYRQIADCCNEAYPKAGMIMTAGKNASVSGFLMQYQETDWAFLKRLASSLHTMLVPSCAVIGEKYFFGIPEKGQREFRHRKLYSYPGKYRKSKPGQIRVFPFAIE